MNAQPTVLVGDTPFFFGGNTMPQHDDLGPFVFEPFALDLASRATVGDGSQALELAFGWNRGYSLCRMNRRYCNCSNRPVSAITR